jgi:hypothetical protein
MIAKENHEDLLINTALGETDYVMSGFQTKYEIYINKPIEMDKIEGALRIFGMI